MATDSKRSRRDTNDYQRTRKVRAIMLTILVALGTAVLVAAMILWTYHSERFKP